MATQSLVATFSAPASGNVSASQYRAVKLNSTGQITACAATTDNVVGILMDDPGAAGVPGTIAYLGVVRAESGTSTIAVGDPLGFDSTGRLVDHTTDNRRILGHALEASTAAGQLFRALITGLSRY